MEHLYWMHVIPVILAAVWPTVDLRVLFKFSETTPETVLHTRHFDR